MQTKNACHSYCPVIGCMEYGVGGLPTKEVSPSVCFSRNRASMRHKEPEPFILKAQILLGDDVQTLSETLSFTAAEQGRFRPRE